VTAVRVSNSEKPLWPDGFTKRAVERLRDLFAPVLELEQRLPR
jgi:hypothetical protein